MNFATTITVEIGSSNFNAGNVGRPGYCWATAKDLW